MQVLLPWEWHGLGQLEEKLKNQNIQDLFKNQSYETKLDIQLPKFKLERKLDLRMSLIGFGMSDMFSAGSADFSGINGKGGLFLSNVVQKALIEVNQVNLLLCHSQLRLSFLIVPILFRLLCWSGCLCCSDG